MYTSPFKTSVCITSKGNFLSCAVYRDISENLSCPHGRFLWGFVELVDVNGEERSLRGPL